MKNLNVLFVALLFLGTVFCWTACSADIHSDYEETDLMRHGLPLKIMAPPELEVKSSKTGGQQNFVLDGGEDYYIEVFKGEFNSGSKQNLLNELRENISSHRFFNGYTLEDEDGFIYEFKIDSLNSNFGFRRVHIQADSEFIFQNGMGRIFTEEQAQNMYNAVAQ